MAKSVNKPGKKTEKVADQKEEVATPVASKTTPAKAAPKATPKKQDPKAGTTKTETPKSSNKRPAPETKDKSAKNQKTEAKQTPSKNKTPLPHNMIVVEGVGHTPIETIKGLFSDQGKIIQCSVQGQGAERKFLIKFATPEEAKEALSRDGALETKVVRKLSVTRVDEAPSAEAEKRVLYVGNLPCNTTESALNKFFDEHKVKPSNIRIHVSQSKGIRKGYALLEFQDPILAQKAKDILTDTSLDGRKLRVEIAGLPSKDNSRKILVKNLGPKTNSETLEQVFSNLGCTPSYARVAQTADENKICYGVLFFATHEQAVQALKHQDVKIDGRAVRLTLDFDDVKIPFTRTL